MKNSRNKKKNHDFNWHEIQLQYLTVSNDIIPHRDYKLFSKNVLELI